MGTPAIGLPAASFQVPPEFFQVPPEFLPSFLSEPDVQLMCRVRDGDLFSFALLLQRYYRPLLQFLYRYVQSEPIAEELTQEVFFRIYRYRGTYVPSAKFATWLFRIAGRIAINSLRASQTEKHSESLDAPDREQTFRRVPDRRPTAEQALLARAQATEIRRAIDLLPTNQRSAVIMHKYQERSYTEIAETLRCSESAVKSLLFRAYERLRNRLAHLVA